jgi:hypothetical protein
MEIIMITSEKLNLIKELYESGEAPKRNIKKY